MITNKTLDELENDYWGDVPQGSSSLVSRCYNLRNVKVEDLELGDLRILISQKIGLNYLIPIVLEILRKNPFVEADFYGGDLLQVILKVDKRFWNTNPVLKEGLMTIFQQKKSLLAELDITKEIKEDLIESFEQFSNP